MLVQPSLLKAQQRAQESYARYQSGQWSHPATSSQANEKEVYQDLFLNDKFIIQNASGYDTSRGSSPSDCHPSSYAASNSSSSTYRNQWIGFDSPTVVSSETYGHYPQINTHLLSPQQSEGHFDEASLYKQHSAMDWTQHAHHTIPKVESPPHSAGLYSPHQQFPPVSIQSIAHNLCLLIS